MGESFLKKDLYTTEKFESLVSKKITEYDIREAGYNLSIYYHLLSDKKLEKLSNMTKEERHIQIGKYQREDKDFSKNITDAFGNMRILFAKSNSLEESDILSIRKDAIYVIGKSLNNTSYGNVMFVPKNTYTSWHKFGRIETFYNFTDNKIDIKGINDSELANHEDFLRVLKKIFKLLETNDKDAFIRFMKKFIKDYKNKNLKYDYYKEFRQNGNYAIINHTEEVKYFIDNIPDQSFDNMIDISYNYINYILPLIQRFYFDK